MCDLILSEGTVNELDIRDDTKLLIYIHVWLVAEFRSDLRNLISCAHSL